MQNATESYSRTMATCLPPPPADDMCAGHEEHPLQSHYDLFEGPDMASDSDSNNESSTLATTRAYSRTTLLARATSREWEKTRGGAAIDRTATRCARSRARMSRRR